MTMQLTDNTGQTFADICEQYGLNIASVQRAFVRAFGGGFDRTMEVQPEHWSELPPLRKIAGSKSKEKAAKVEQPKKPIVRVKAPITPVPAQTETVKEEAAPLWFECLRDQGYMTLLFLAPIGHAILVWNEAWARYGQKGFFAGLTMAIITLAALLLCLDDSKGITNKTALYLVGVLDFCSFFLHREEFGSDPVSTGFAVIIPLCSFAALYMLREVKNL